jgi:hypothetical protein
MVGSVLMGPLLHLRGLRDETVIDQLCERPTYQRIPSARLGQPANPASDEELQD